MQKKISPRLTLVEPAKKQKQPSTLRSRYEQSIALEESLSASCNTIDYTWVQEYKKTPEFNCRL